MQRVSSTLHADGMPAFAFGGDYSPEQWPEDVWAQDVELMKQAGVNLVSVAIFSWALIEVEEGVYDFGWLDRALDLLNANGIKVDLANATASPPPWFSHRYPDSLPMNVDGVRISYGSRQAYCSSSLDYRRAAGALTRAIAQRYGSHPAVVMWHVNNEYGCHNQPCYCDASAEAFRVWLTAKYGSVEKLNEAWGTAFWSQHYTAWEQILPPRRSGTFVNPTQQLDFARFSSDDVMACCVAEVEILHELTVQPVTTNFMGHSMDLHRPIDYWRWSDELDLISNDHYLIAEDPRNFQDLAMAADVTRGWAGGEPWLLMEHSTSAVNWQQRNLAKRPGEMLRNSLQHVARGADGVLFFQWRASSAGAEKFHSALVPHVGTDTAVWREVVALGGVLNTLREVVGSRVVDVKVALMNDTDARWGSELDAHPSIDVTHMAETRRWHDAFYRLGLSTDFVTSAHDLSPYSLVVLPVHYILADAAIARLRAYVEQGGHVAVTYFSGVTDENDHIRLGGYGGELAQLLGVRIDQFAPLANGETVTLSDGSTGALWSEYTRTTGAEVLATFESGATVGCPALTRNTVGSGVAYYVATSLAQPDLVAVVSRIARESVAREVTALPDGVEVSVRSNGEQKWTFVINHSASIVDLPISGTDLLGDAVSNSHVTVSAGGVAVVRSP